TEDELHYLRDLLTGGDTSWVAARGLMPSLLVDGINEKCYGEFGDTVLEAGDPPSVIEDYKEDLKGQLEP
ncbi:tellurite resistance TerB C-terminal domain-containing protein, partial [Acidaminococcus timonensis]